MSANQMLMGIIDIGGKQFIERWQVIPFEITMNANLATTGQIKVPLPGVYDFRLKGLTRDTLVAGASTVRRFRVALGNSDGAVWYQQGGLGSTTDKVVDSNMFGNGQFPYPVIPSLFFGRNAAIMMNIDDLSNAGGTYVIAFAFHGAYLIPIS